MKQIPFKIEHLDPLGQGVSKIDEKITFIPKTLPDEEGVATVWRSAKGVQFATVHELTKSSSHRITPICPHYNECPGCSYLHTNYQQELLFKKQSFEHSFKVSPQIIPASERVGYRNRVQLHFRDKWLGYINAATKKIVPSPNCKLPIPSIQKKIKDLYERPKNYKRPGHLEIYQPPKSSLEINYNRPYAYGGFSQVNQDQNLKLCQLVLGLIPNNGKVLDLFGGDGNLSQGIESRWIVDLYPKSVSPPFIRKNIFDIDAASSLKRLIKEDIDTLILDPPRQGMKNIKEFIELFKPRSIIYVSCNFHTQLRDLDHLNKLYTAKSHYLLDLFPSTSHFETIVHLERT